MMPQGAWRGQASGPGVRVLLERPDAQLVRTVSHFPRVH